MAKFTMYNVPEKGSESKYPTWKDSQPNLQTYLAALNLSQPISQCQYELVWSRWPRTLFFAKNITIPGVSVNTLDLNHAGFTIAIPTHVTYENNEITMNIIADKEGFHYYDIRNMVMQTGHPLVAGDPRATIGNLYKISPSEDQLEIRLRNKPSDETHHHWIVHNFHPTVLGDVELSVDGSAFVEFELTGTFTHITYDCGKQGEYVDEPAPETNDDTPSEEPNENEENEDENKQDGCSDSPGTQEEEDQSSIGKLSEDEDQLPTKSDKDAFALMEKNNRHYLTKEEKESIKKQLAEENPDIPDETIEVWTKVSMERASNEWIKKHATKTSDSGEEKREVYMTSRADKKMLLIIGSTGVLAELDSYKALEYDNMPLLVKCVRSNYNITENITRVFIVPEDEIENYENNALKITQLSLPHRFGMYKSLKNHAKVEHIELEEPKDSLDSTSSEIVANPNHKKRSIF